MAAATIGDPQGSGIGPILSVIYFIVTPIRLLNADDVKLIARRNHHKIFQSPLNASTQWSKDWELNLNPTKSEHPLIDIFPYFVTYPLPSHSPTNTHAIPRASIIRYLVIVLKIRPTADDNAVTTVNKARRMLCDLKISLAALIHRISSPNKAFLSGHTLSKSFKSFSHYIPRRRGFGKNAEACCDVRKRPSAYSVWRSYQSASSILPNPSVDHSWTSAILHLHLSNPFRATLPYAIISSTNSGVKKAVSSTYLGVVPLHFGIKYRPR